MDFTKMKDRELLSETAKLVLEERKIGIEVLLHLREIEKRRLFAGLGFSSLFDYCVSELRYSESAAYRRIAAMRLLRDLPDDARAKTQAELKEGSLSITILSQVYSALAPAKKSKASMVAKQTVEVLSRVAGKSSRDCQKILAEINPRVAFPDRERVLNEREIEIRFVADNELREKFDRIRGLIAHREVGEGLAGLLHFLADMALERLDPAMKKSRNTQNATHPKRTPAKSLPAPEVRSDTATGATTSERQTRAMVWRREGGRCSFVDPKSGRRCASTFALQIDHIHPRALGGASTTDNLRLLCRNHNLWAAAQTYGTAKMERAMGG